MATLSPLKADILAFLNSTGKRVCSTGYLAEKLGEDKARVLRALKQLQAEKEVMKEPGLKNYFGSLDANWKINEWK